ncbi:hypothetical protein [Microbacterium protaetiae]|uniref:hypothetical protein n=1 Tax=Microbacterium protaetiae TaxID=2509458 RepID=UPI0013ED5507|nr:hypothetical protein [Microbacterium protaetiae]
MDVYEQSPRDGLRTATIRELLVELDGIEKEREQKDCFRLRSRERGICAELARRRHDGLRPEWRSALGEAEEGVG